MSNTEELEAFDESEEEATAMTQAGTPMCRPPCVVVAHTDEVYGQRLQEQLSPLGWKVRLARNAEEARRLAIAFNPVAVILDTQLADESGWLMCAKLTWHGSEWPIILVSPQPTPEQERLASFVGATALVPQHVPINRIRHGKTRGGRRRSPHVAYRVAQPVCG